MNRGYKLSRNSQKYVDSCETLMHELVKRAMEIANIRKLHCPDWGVSAGKRTTDEQFNLFRKGRNMVVNTHGRNVYEIVNQNEVVTYCDGYTKRSPHQDGLAIDIYAYVDGKANYEPGNLALVFTCFQEAAKDMGITIEWGGNYNSLADAPHIEIV